FSYLVHKDLFTQFDFNTTVRLQDKIPARFDSTFFFFSEIGSFEVLTIVLIFLLLLWRSLKAILFFITYGAFHLFEIYGKVFVDHLPPPQFMLKTKRLFDFPQFHVRAENSYPSGHAGRTAFLSIVFILLIWRSKRLSQEIKIGLIGIVLLFDIAMFVSRPYLGEHWTTDVIGGALLGTGLAIMTYALAK